MLRFKLGAKDSTSASSVAGRMMNNYRTMDVAIEDAVVGWDLAER